MKMRQKPTLIITGVVLSVVVLIGIALYMVQRNNQTANTLLGANGSSEGASSDSSSAGPCVPDAANTTAPIETARLTFMGAEQSLTFADQAFDTWEAQLLTKGECSAGAGDFAIPRTTWDALLSTRLPIDLSIDSNAVLPVDFHEPHHFHFIDQAGTTIFTAAGIAKSPENLPSVGSMIVIFRGDHALLLTPYTAQNPYPAATQQIIDDFLATHPDTTFPNTNFTELSGLVEHSLRREVPLSDDVRATLQSLINEARTVNVQ